MPTLVAIAACITPQAGAQEQPECAELESATDVSILTSASVSDSYRDAHSLATGAGVKVAVIDTGVANHPRLGGVEDGGNLVGDPFDAYFDCDRHGTVVAGVIAARDNGDGIAGVAPGATIISVRQTTSLKQRSNAADVSGGSLQSLIDALHVAMDKGADVINVSVVSCLPPGSRSVDTSGLDAAMNRAEQLGVVVVSAAGNQSSTCPQGSTTYPAHHDKVVGVAAYESPSAIAEYSIDSPLPQLSALGAVPTALSSEGTGLVSGTKLNGAVLNFQGTSFAAPVVSGTAALLKQRHPRATAHQIRTMLFDSVDPATGALDPVRAVSMVYAEPATPHTVDISTNPEANSQPTARALTFLFAVLLACITGLAFLGRQHSKKS